MKHIANPLVVLICLLLPPFAHAFSDARFEVTRIHQELPTIVMSSPQFSIEPIGRALTFSELESPTTSPTPRGNNRAGRYGQKMEGVQSNDPALVTSEEVAMEINTETATYPSTTPTITPSAEGRIGSDSMNVTDDGTQGYVAGAHDTQTVEKEIVYQNLEDASPGEHRLTFAWRFAVFSGVLFILAILRFTTLWGKRNLPF